MGEKKEDFNQYKYQNNYIKEHYVRKSVTIPNYLMNDINIFMKAKGFDKFGPYVMDLIKKDMEGHNQTTNINIGDIEHSGKGDININ